MRKAKKAELLNRILQLNMRSDTTFSKYILLMEVHFLINQIGIRSVHIINYVNNIDNMLH